MELSDKLFARLVFLNHTFNYTLSENAYVACLAYGDGKLEDLGLVTISIGRRSSDLGPVYYFRNITSLGKAVIRTANPARLALAFEKYKMWHAMASTIQNCSIEQLLTFLSHGVKFIRSAAEHRFRKLTNGS